MLKTCVIISSFFFQTEYIQVLLLWYSTTLRSALRIHCSSAFSGRKFEISLVRKAKPLDSDRFSTNNNWFLKFSFQTEYKYCYDLVLHYVLHYLNKDTEENANSTSLQPSAIVAWSFEQCVAWNRKKSEKIEKNLVQSRPQPLFVFVEERRGPKPRLSNKFQ